MAFRAIWPPNADHRVTTRATKEQLISWSTAARQLSNRPLPVFLAFAADFTVKYFERMQEQAERTQARRDKARQKKKQKQEQEP